jgi:hypothetical protein
MSWQEGARNLSDLSNYISSKIEPLSDWSTDAALLSIISSRNTQIPGLCDIYFKAAPLRLNSVES